MLMSLGLVVVYVYQLGGWKDRGLRSEPGGLAQPVGVMVDSPEVFLYLEWRVRT